ncbi:hypothetical protein IQ07DRAFT_640094 [Pyrenochaeta sp. DS3sAY3a]|nr:hypothetical protein IQ07DRAFT_640094 [Pyrenochaeta sp. DS3sAY3a]
MSSLSRKERKRVADRIAQREHRKRQKRYVEDLESQLTLAREGGQSEMAAILAENRSLRREVAQLRDICSSMEILMAKVKAITPTTPTILAAEPELEPELEAEDQFAASIDMNGLSDMDVSQPAKHQFPETIDLPNGSTRDIYPLDHAGTNENLHELNHSCADLSHDSLAWSSVLQPIPDSTADSYTRFSSPSFSNATYDFMGMSAPSPLPHKFMPLNTSPPLSSDLLIHWILDRAATQPNPPRAPTLDDFFSENPNNRLARDVKVLLEPMRGKNTNSLLALYWIIYLLIKWESSQEYGSYYALPIWLRPTQMQLTIRHPIALDLMPW